MMKTILLAACLALLALSCVTKPQAGGGAFERSRSGNQNAQREMSNAFN